jgi:spore maturation protein CgeB
MSVDAYGAHGCNAARFWEIIGQGSLLITQPVMIFMPYPFLEGQDYWEFKDMDQLEFVVRYALDNPDQTADMAKSAHSHALQYHSSPARVIYMLREANKFIPDCANIFTSVG